MTFRFTPKTLFGTTAMLAFGASMAAAQMPRSDQRIPVTKEAPGEVVRTDTVMIYRTDTLQLTTRVVDTVRVTRTRIDTVIPRLPKYSYPRGFYGGIAGGFMTPSGGIYIPNSTGGTAQIQLGWQNAKQVVGFRVDANGAWPGRDSRFSALQDQARIFNFNADLKLQLPFNFGGHRLTAKDDPCEPATTYTRGPFHRFAIYAIGGYTYTTFRNLPLRINAPDSLLLGNIAVVDGNQVVVIDEDNVADFFDTDDNRVAFFRPGEDDWHSRSGWNAGGGVSMFWGHSELFLEARVLGFRPHNAPWARQVPVVLGFNWY